LEITLDSAEEIINWVEKKYPKKIREVEIRFVKNVLATRP
jgi:hypothetical protein